ncbi:MAG: hypothetical protein ACLQMH_17090 [Solirubrobacteraceae bacterium]
MATDRMMVERALYARAERLAEIDRRDDRGCYACGGDRFAPIADGGLALCVNCQEFVYPVRWDHRRSDPSRDRQHKARQDKRTGAG